MIPPMLHSTAVSLPDAEPATVLVVDDTPANLTLMSSVLREHWRVQLANSGAKALELAHRQAPDLILLDIMMPGMDGYETLRHLRGDPATRDIPVIFVTAMDADEDEEGGLRQGAVAYLVKPVATEQLVRKAQAALST
jgi:putative two-component system response regulator